MAQREVSFGSDVHSGIHPKVLEAIEQANIGHVPSYGDDPYTQRATEKFRELFGDDTRAFFVFAGAPANVLGLETLLKPYEAVVCAATAHINVDECGGPERYLGSKLLTIQTEHGKITPEQVEPFLTAIGNEHHAQPRVISITQCTELGTVYKPDEISALADFAHSHGMYLHMDGARFANAVVALNVNPRALTTNVGLDVMSFGGTKNGLMGGEAVVIFRPELAKDFKYLRRQAMQLSSKMRFLSAQFEAVLTDDLWLENARHANAMAKRLADNVSELSGVEVIHPVETNALFVRFPKDAIPKLQQHSFFYVWKEATNEVRWMTSFDTTEEDVDKFSNAIKKVLANR